jgi:catechol 2,3-dioxygenase-like lactoylglutathione lyase family enzyme
MKRPILDKLFHMQIPVPRLDDAISWYVEHLGFKLTGKQEGELAFLDLPSGPMLMLWETPDHTSANFTVRGETFPVLLYHTNDIHKLHDQLNELNVEITFYQDEGFRWVLKFYDPFGNMWGVIQPKRNLPFDFGIGNVFVPVTNMPRAVAWYRNILGLKPDEKYAEGADPEERTVYAIRLEHVSLLLDSMQRETLKPSPNQLFTFETQSLREAYSYLKEKGVEFGISEEEILGNPNRKAFQFLDCEGNSLIMHQPH